MNLPAGVAVASLFGLGAVVIGRNRGVPDFSPWPVVVLVLAGIAIVLWYVPRIVVRQFKKSAGSSATPTPKELFDIENETRKSMSQIVGGLAFLVGLAFTWQQLANTQRQLDLAERKEINDRYAKATEQLASDNVSERLGAIYSLERIGGESGQDAVSIRLSLIAFVRIHAGIERGAVQDSSSEFNEADEDVTEAVKAIADLPVTPVPNEPCLDLSNVNLAGADLRGLDLRGACLDHSNLTNANLDRAILTGVGLAGANLSGASLNLANLDYANLNGADLTEANLYGASLNGTVLVSAVLDRAGLKGTNLASAIGLNPTKLALSCYDLTTTLPENPAFKDSQLPPFGIGNCQGQQSASVSADDAAAGQTLRSPH